MQSTFEFKLAAFQFTSLRGEFYIDLAQSMKAAPGVSITKILERYARRYKKEPIGILCAHWLALFPHTGRFTDAAKGSIPDQDIALLAASESAGDLTTGLRQLGENILALKKVKSDVWSALGAALFLVIILHVFIGIESFQVMPKMESAMRGGVDITKLGSTADFLFGAATLVRGYWWAWFAFFFSLIGLVVWSLPNYVGRHRRWLDNNIFPFQMYRDFNGASFIVTAASLSGIVGSQIVQFYEALNTIRSLSKTPWLTWQVGLIQSNLRNNPNAKAEIFNTGITSLKMYYRILDIADYAELDVMLERIGAIIMEVAPVETKKRATSLRFFIMTFAMVIILGTYGGTVGIIDSFKAQVQMKMMG